MDIGITFPEKHVNSGCTCSLSLSDPLCPGLPYMSSVCVYINKDCGQNLFANAACCLLAPRGHACTWNKIFESLNLCMWSPLSA